VQGYFYDWQDRNLFERINFELLLQTRTRIIVATKRSASVPRLLVVLTGSRQFLGFDRFWVALQRLMNGCTRLQNAH
jgi:hypothetical protein